MKNSIKFAIYLLLAVGLMFVGTIGDEVSDSANEVFILLVVVGAIFLLLAARQYRRIKPKVALPKRKVKSRLIAASIIGIIGYSSGCWCVWDKISSLPPAGKAFFWGISAVAIIICFVLLFGFSQKAIKD